MQYVLVKGDVSEVNSYAIQIFHRVNVFGSKGQIQAGAFMTVFAQHSVAIIRGWLL